MTRRPSATAEKASQALEMRLGGSTYKEIAAAFGYANQSGGYELVLRAVGDDERLRQAIRGYRARPPMPYDDGDGYLRVRRPGHPLARKNGEISQHRMALYDELGPGPHPCAVCGLVLDWSQLDVDHVNGDRADNRLENLQPCCRSCNTSLGWHRRGWRPGVDYPAWMDDPDCPADFHGWDWERAA